MEIETETAAETHTTEAADSADVIVHARFAPDGSCLAIGESPAWASPQQWFNLLNRSTANSYKALACGRGTFTISRQRLEELKSMQ